MESQLQPAETPVAAITSLLSDREVADLLQVKVDWIRSHAEEIPGFTPLGSYYRFRPKLIEQWLGSLDRLLNSEQVAKVLKVPTSWVYQNADQIPGLIRLGRYVRFRPTVINQFVGGSETCQ